MPSRSSGRKHMSGNVGTVEFRAPELMILEMTQKMRRGIAYDDKVDVWSFGMVVFELLAMCAPYRRENIQSFALVAHIASGQRPLLPSVVLGEPLADVHDDAASSASASDSHASDTPSVTDSSLGSSLAASPPVAAPLSSSLDELSSSRRAALASPDNDTSSAIVSVPSSITHLNNTTFTSSTITQWFKTIDSQNVLKVKKKNRKETIIFFLSVLYMY